MATALLAACAPAPEVGVSLYQTRSDTPVGKVEIQVRNLGAEPVTVDRAELRSTRLAGSAVWEEPVEILPGTAMDLKVVLPGADCTGAAGETVSLRIDGSEVVLDAPDTLGQVGEYVAQACFAQEVAAIARIEVVGVTDEGLRMLIEPGPAQIGRLAATILFAPADLDAIAALPGSRGGLREVVLRPNRCDAHAVGEDKQGTYFDVDVTLPDGRSGPYTVGVDPQQRGQLYRLYARLCGLS